MCENKEPNIDNFILRAIKKITHTLAHSAYMNEYITPIAAHRYENPLASPIIYFHDILM